MKTVTFYHSIVCPRCRLAALWLSRLRPEFPEIAIEKVEYLAALGRSRRAGIKRIPALVAGEHVLSGFYLSQSRIRDFLESVSVKS